MSHNIRERALPRPPTDYGRAVVASLASMSSESGVIDQRMLRYFLALSPAYLLLDSTTNSTSSFEPQQRSSRDSSPRSDSSSGSPSPPPLSGIQTWDAGFNRLVDILLALHARGELELETLNVASQACSECWTVASSWPAGGVGEETRVRVRNIASKLRSVLDENRRTYRGGLVYVP